MKYKLSCLLFGHTFRVRIDGGNIPSDNCADCGLTKEEVGISTKSKSALAIIEAIRTAFKDQSEIGVNHLNVELDYLKEQLGK